MAFIVASGFDGFGAVFLRSVCNPSNDLLVGLEFTWIGSIVLGHYASIAKSSNLIDGCNWSEDILVIAKACQPNFNARASNFAALDEHKLIGFREDYQALGCELSVMNGCHRAFVWVEQAIVSRSMHVPASPKSLCPLPGPMRRRWLSP